MQPSEHLEQPAPSRKKGARHCRQVEASEQTAHWLCTEEHSRQDPPMRNCPEEQLRQTEAEEHEGQFVHSLQVGASM